MIYILGGKGFIGSAFARWCEKNNSDHIILSRDNYESYIGTYCDILINANGNSSKILAKEDPLKDFDSSVRSVKQTLLDFKANLYVYLSSCDVYTDCSRPELTYEDSPIDIKRQSSYGFHKYLAEQCVIHGHPEWLVFRMGGFVGVGLKKNSIYDILNRNFLWLDPESKLQFLNTYDAVNIVMEIIGKKIKREIFNLCGDGTIELNEVIAYSQKSPTIKKGSPKVHYEISIDKLKRLLQVPPSRNTVFAFIDEYSSPYNSEDYV